MQKFALPHMLISSHAKARVMPEYSAAMRCRQALALANSNKPCRSDKSGKYYSVETEICQPSYLLLNFQLIILPKVRQRNISSSLNHVNFGRKWVRKGFQDKIRHRRWVRSLKLFGVGQGLLYTSNSPLDRWNQDASEDTDISVNKIGLNYQPWYYDIRIGNYDPKYQTAECWGEHTRPKVHPCRKWNWNESDNDSVVWLADCWWICVSKDWESIDLTKSFIRCQRYILSKKKKNLAKRAKFT